LQGEEEDGNFLTRLISFFKPGRKYEKVSWKEETVALSKERYVRRRAQTYPVQAILNAKSKGRTNSQIHVLGQTNREEEFTRLLITS